MDVDNDLLDTCRAEPFEHMVEQGLAGDFDQRLRPSGSERAHPLAKPRGHHHRRFWHVGRNLGAET